MIINIIKFSQALPFQVNFSAGNQVKSSFEIVPSLSGNTDPHRLGGIFNPGRQIDRIAEDIVKILSRPDNAADHMAAVDTDPVLPAVSGSGVSVLEVLDDLDSAIDDIGGMVRIALGKTANGQIGVANGFNPFTMIAVNNFIKGGENFGKFIDQGFGRH